MVTSGIVAFFSVQPAMLDQMPQLGHIPKLFKAMSSRNDSIPKTALQIVQQLSNSEVCPELVVVFFLVLTQFAYGPADATATPSSLALVKSRMVYLSGASLPRLSWKKAVKRM